MASLSGKRILFLDGLNNLYHYGLIEGFKSLGATVVPIVYRDFENRSILSLLKRKFLNNKNVDEKKLMNSINGDFDYVFIKNPEIVSEQFFVKLKSIYPNSPMINYNWNSISHIDYRKYIPLFDKVYSFDPIDANKHSLIYYPLFYLPEFEKKGITNFKKKYTISFVGSAFTPGRANFMSKLMMLINEKSIIAFIYLHAFTFVYYKNIFLKNYNFKKYLSTKYFSQEELLKIYEQSAAFIDHPMNTQDGHTIRTFETLGAGLMLITTNKALVNEPFYDSNRIKIIKEDLSDLNLEEIKDFIPSFPIGFEKYRVDNWLNQILLS